MNKVQIQLLNEIVEAAETGRVEFTEWEDGFIDSLYLKGSDYKLSEKQNETLNRLSQKAQRGY